MQFLRSIGAVLLGAAVLTGSLLAAEPLPPAGQWMPAGALLVVEVSGAGDVLDLVLGDDMIAAVAAVPAMQQQKQPDNLAQARQIVGFLEAHLGTDWKTAARSLLGGGATLAAYPDKSILLVVDSNDAAMLEKFREFATLAAKGEAAKNGNPEAVQSGEYRGMTGWTFGKKEAHAVIGNRLIVASGVDRLKSVADLREDGGAALADQPEYKAAKAAAGPGADAFVMLNMAALKQAPDVQKGLDNFANPGASLLLAGVAESVRAASVLTLALDVQGDTLALAAVSDGKIDAAKSSVAFAQTTDGRGALPNLKVPGFLAGFSVYRDMHGFYAAKDELFPERTGGLIFFENMMGIFFSGRDLTDEVLAQAEPQIRILAAQQKYDDSTGTPKTQIPAFAAVLRMKDPEKFSIVMEEAWQKAIGLVNFTRGQKAEPGLIIDRPTQGDTRFTVARFAAPKVEERTDADARFNFNPSLAMPDGYLILSSTEGLARDLIDAVKNETTETLAGIQQVHSLAEVDGANLASILQVNRESLVRKNMLDDGNSRDQAETAIDTLLALVGHLGQTRFEIRNESGATQARFVVQLKLAAR
ncbi:MAG: hypothetical protein ACYC6Y_22255 [Thermoguttaceae bacterium]